MTVEDRGHEALAAEVLDVSSGLVTSADVECEICHNARYITGFGGTGRRRSLKAGMNFYIATFPRSTDRASVRHIAMMVTTEGMTLSRLAEHGRRPLVAFGCDGQIPQAFEDAVTAAGGDVNYSELEGCGIEGL